jgi:hypothetical protein
MKILMVFSFPIVSNGRRGGPPSCDSAAAPGAVTLLPLPTFSNGPEVTLTWDPAAFTPKASAASTG